MLALHKDRKDKNREDSDLFSTHSQIDPLDLTSFASCSASVS